MSKFYAYLYIDPSNDEKIYVGKGKDKRAFHHVTRTDNHPFTQRLRKMMRTGYEPEILIFEAIDEDHAFFLEECLIEIIGRKDLGRGTLLNLTNGGDGLRNPSPKTRQLIGAASKGRVASAETRQKMSASHKPLSQESYRKVSLAMKTMTLEKRAKLDTARCKPCTVDGETIYQSVKELVNVLGCGKAGLRNPNFRFIPKLKS